jgi:hypothetical protein
MATSGAHNDATGRIAGNPAYSTVSASTNTKIYTVPSSMQRGLVDAYVTIINQDGSNTIYVFVWAQNTGASVIGYFLYNSPLAPACRRIVPIGALAPTDEVWVYSNDADAKFTLHGDLLP